MEATLGKRITANRKRLGMTQDQLAEKLGITAQAVSKWENDLSCPDISILPKLADIFGVTTDELLGREPAATVCKAEVVSEEDTQRNGFTFDNGKLDLHWDGCKLEGIGLACWVLLTGGIYLAAQLLDIHISFWNVMWPTFLLMLGLFGLYPKFSAFRLGCALVGGYYLMDKLHILSISIDSGVLIAVAVLLFGCGLLADALHKKPRFNASYTDKNGKLHHGKTTRDYTVDGNHFTYEANFGSSTQFIRLENLQNGNISTNFGEYTLDLSAVAAVEANCRLDAECNFGELTLLVPRCYCVMPDSSTSFASFEIMGQPDSNARGTIYLSASVSFGEICIRYI